MKSIRPIYIVVPGLLATASACEVSGTFTETAGTGYSATANIAGGAIITNATYSNNTADLIVEAWNYTADCSNPVQFTEYLEEPVLTTSMVRYQNIPAAGLRGAGSHVKATSTKKAQGGGVG